MQRVLSLALSLCILVAAPACLAPLSAAAGEMTFRTARLGDAHSCGAAGCPAVIVARGEITNETPERFLDFVERNSKTRDFHAVVFLDSPGGRVVASMELGTLLRKLGAAAVVARISSDVAGGSVVTNAECYSACVYALMGAVKRVIPASSQVGIHRMFVFEEDVDATGTATLRQRRFNNGDMKSFLMRYSAEMGVSPGLIAAAERVPSDRLKILSRSEIHRWRLGVSAF